MSCPVLKMNFGLAISGTFCHWPLRAVALMTKRYHVPLTFHSLPFPWDGGKSFKWMHNVWGEFLIHLFIAVAKYLENFKGGGKISFFFFLILNVVFYVCVLPICRFVHPVHPWCLRG